MPKPFVQTMGASLYVPCNHKNLLEIANGEILTNTRSLIFCTEDSVAESMLSYAIFNLTLTLENMRAEIPAERFVRVRNPEILQRILALKGVEKLTGFVIPKASAENFLDYFALVKDTHHVLMPTLETSHVFDDAAMHDFRALLAQPEIRPSILALRIGGNDLLALLGLRRPRNMTIYQTPLGQVIARLVTCFKPHGFELTAPVFEYLDLPELLAQEISYDLAHGLIGKTAIHPGQIDDIEWHYRVQEKDIESAKAILDENSQAVFKMHEAMCEVATHRAWAKRTLARAELFGAHSREFTQNLAQHKLHNATF